MTSAPERRRSLGMRWRELHSNDDSRVREEPQGGEVLFRQVKGHSFLEVSGDLVQRATLSDDRNFDAFRHVSRLLTRSNHCFDRVLQHRHFSFSRFSIAQV